MQINIVKGAYTDEAADFRTALPLNMVPIPFDHGISAGYLRPADGVVQTGTGPGISRGGINWNGLVYRVMGPQFLRVNTDGSTTFIGAVPGVEQVSFDYSFDRLAIAAGQNLYYYDGANFTQVVDADLGPVLDVIWIDGYFMTTDGISLVVTELTDPYSVNPLKYGSSEVDPDPIVGLLKLRNEAYAINRNTIEIFDNIGGTLFPFQRVAGAQIPKGAIGTHCAVIYDEQVAFLGGNRNEPPAIWIGVNSAVQKLSNREVDTLLIGYTEAQLSKVVMEVRRDKGLNQLMVHLPGQTLVHDLAASALLQQPIWFSLGSGEAGPAQYLAKDFVWAYDGWQVGSPADGKLGRMDNTLSTHYGATVGWEFSTSITYNESMGAIFHKLELVALPGRVAFGIDPTVWTSYSIDGEEWSQEWTCMAGKQGDRTRRITWFRQGHMRNWRIQKFRGNSDAHVSFARLEAQLEPLNG